MECALSYWIYRMYKITKSLILFADNAKINFLNITRIHMHTGNLSYRKRCVIDTLDAISDDANRFQKEHLTEEKIRNFKQFINFVPDCWFTIVEINLSLIFLRHRISLSPCIFRMILIHLQHSFLSFVVFFYVCCSASEISIHCSLYAVCWVGQCD